MLRFTVLYVAPFVRYLGFTLLYSHSDWTPYVAVLYHTHLRHNDYTSLPTPPGPDPGPRGSQVPFSDTFVPEAVMPHGGLYRTPSTSTPAVLEAFHDRAGTRRAEGPSSTFMRERARRWEPSRTLIPDPARAFQAAAA